MVSRASSVAAAHDRRIAHALTQDDFIRLALHRPIVDRELSRYGPACTDGRSQTLKTPSVLLCTPRILGFPYPL